jgi:U32 family peptidase
MSFNRFLNIFTDFHFFEPDALIVQDIGMISLMKKHFPGIPLHASTQMSVHNSEGVKLLQEQGIGRVVLSRELTISDIKTILKNCPDMEFEVFIHGALCYSFSGKCLASGFIAGRSANKGECIQLCRDYYNEENGSSRFLFSCRDLALYENVRKYAQIGITSLKIEGRMKPPEYSFYASKLYKAIIESRPENEISLLKQNLSLIYERYQTEAYMNSSSGDGLICNSYASHKGIELGVVEKNFKQSFTLKLNHTLSIKDGLMFFERPGDLEPYKFSVQTIKNQSGREVKWLEAGNIAEIEAEKVPAKGTVIFQISHRNLDMKNINDAALPQYFIKAAVEAEINEGVVRLTGKIEDGISATVEENVSIEQAKKDSDLKMILEKHLRTADEENLFAIDSVTVKNLSSFKDSEIFIPPSQLKSAKRSLVTALKTAFKRSFGEFRFDIPQPHEAAVRHEDLLSIISDRGSINPLTVIEDNESRELPFAENFHLRHPETLCHHDNFIFVPLKPVIKDSDTYISEFIDLVKANPDKTFVTGLNNLSHFTLIEKAPSNVLFFCDIFIYAANSFALDFISSLSAGRILSVFSWIEKDDIPGLTEHGITLLKISETFKRPLFYSLGCYKKHNHEDCRNCTKEGVYHLENRKRHYKVIVKDCVTYMFAE